MSQNNDVGARSHKGHFRKQLEKARKELGKSGGLYLSKDRFRNLVQKAGGKQVVERVRHLLLNERSIARTLRRNIINKVEPFTMACEDEDDPESCGFVYGDGLLCDAIRDHMPLEYYWPEIAGLSWVEQDNCIKYLVVHHPPDSGFLSNRCFEKYLIANHDRELGFEGQDTRLWRYCVHAGGGLKVLRRVWDTVKEDHSAIYSRLASVSQGRDEVQPLDIANAVLMEYEVSELWPEIAGLERDRIVELVTELLVLLPPDVLLNAGQWPGLAHALSTEYHIRVCRS